MAQQTAVEWLLYEQFKLNMTKGLTKSQYLARRKKNEEQAKAMEKMQIENAYDCALFGHGINGQPCASGGKYYNETYTDKPKLAYGVYNDISNKKPDRPLPGEGEGGR